MTAIYGLIGRKLGHSFSKGYFTEKFHSAHNDAVYENFELKEIADFISLLEAHPQMRGCNVTIPYKSAIIPYLSSLSPLAEAVGAVNCISIKGNMVMGHNTDVIGFRDSLAEVYVALPGGKALILGTGGAAKAVYYALDHFFEFDSILFISRNPKMPDQISYANLATNGLDDVRLIVNTTPLGMHPEVDVMPEIDFGALPQDAFVFDLIYNPEETKLLAMARAHGCLTLNGLDMLMRQAEASWLIWNQG